MTIALATRQELLSCSPDNLLALSSVRSEAFSATIKALTQPDCDLVAVLLCGLFFIGYECLQDPMDINPDTSVRHLGSGLRILEEYHTSNKTHTSSVTDIIREYLEPMYLQMEMMFSLFSTPVHTIRDVSLSSTAARRPVLPARFTNLHEARRWFLSIYRWQYHYRADGNKIWSATSSAFSIVRAVFVEWYALIMAYNDALSNSAGDVLERQNLMTVVSHWSLLMVGMVHSTASATSPFSSQSTLGTGLGSPFLPNGGRLKASVVDLTDPTYVIVTFIVDKRSLSLLEICDWTETGLSGDPSLRIWPVAEVRRLEDGSGRGIVKLRMG
jgi:hypothetical protein